MFALKKMITAAALTFAAMSAQAAPTLTVSTPTVTNGGSVDVNFVVSDFADLNGYGLTVNFNAALLGLTSITSGSFMASGGTPDFGFILGTTAGEINYIYDTLSAGQGAFGSGTLFTLHFNTLGVGTSLISFSDLIMFDSTLTDIAFTATGGSVTSLPVIVPPGTDVPEPATLLLLGVGGAAFMMRRNGAKALKQVA